MKLVSIHVSMAFAGALFVGVSLAHAQSAPNATSGGIQTQAEIAALRSATAGRSSQVGFAPQSSSTLGTSGAYRGAVNQIGSYPYPAGGPPKPLQPTYAPPRMTLPAGILAPPQNIPAAGNTQSRNIVQTSYNVPRTVTNPPQPTQLSIGTNSTIGKAQRSAKVPIQNVFPSQSVAQPQYAAYRQPIYQASTLGLGGAPYQAGQTCYCQPTYTPVVQTSARQPVAPTNAVGSGLATTAIPTPVLAGQATAPSAVPASPTAYPYPAANQPNQHSVGRAPVVSPGSTPVVRQNLPVGTYYGTGLVGQPKAYVDGQPVRNFFRFVFP